MRVAGGGWRGRIGRCGVGAGGVGGGGDEGGWAAVHGRPFVNGRPLTAVHSQPSADGRVCSPCNGRPYMDDRSRSWTAVRGLQCMDDHPLNGRVPSRCMEFGGIGRSAIKRNDVPVGDLYYTSFRWIPTNSISTCPDQFSTDPSCDSQVPIGS